MSGWTKPRLADAPNGKTRSQGPVEPKACHCPLYISTTPATIAAMLKICRMRRCSSSSNSANNKAKTGDNPPTAPAMFGPINRLDSKFNSATAAGKSNPTQANRPAAFTSTSAGSMRKGAKHQNKTVDVGTLNAAPSRGSIQRNANCVSTKAAPKANAEKRPKKTASG